jgi:hypothetical protein
MAQQAAAQGQEAPQVVTLERIDALLKSERMRPFALEIETDSTIAPNEEAEKQSRGEFLQAVGSFFNQVAPLVQQQPETAPLMAELMKFGIGAFRAGRDLGGEFEQFAEQLKAKAGQQGQQPSPEQIKAQADAQAKAQELELKGRELAIREAETQHKIATDDSKSRMDALLKSHELQIRMGELGIKQDDQALKGRQADIDAMLQVAELELEREQDRPVGIGNN